MSDRVMMKCGHVAEATNTDTGEPACVICLGTHPGATEVDDAPPDLSGRTARCSYSRGATSHFRNAGPCRGNPGQRCDCERPSSPHLAFFTHRPEQAHDEFYCGCHGWS